jgi:polysaccharide biosynthesis protein PslH
MTERVCVVSLDDPWGPAHGGTHRTCAFIDAFLDAGAETHVVFLGATREAISQPGLVLHPMLGSPAGERSAVRRLGRVKRRYFPVPTSIGARLPQVTKVVASTQPSIVHVSQLRAAQYAGPAKLWLDQADLLSGLLAHEIDSRRGLPAATARAQRWQIARNEQRFARAAHIVTAAGFSDAVTLRKTAPATTWLPVPMSGRPVAVGEPRARVAGMLGNFAFWPNRDAYEVLRLFWGPLLKREGWRVVVAGYESESLPPSPDIEILGEVDDVSTFYAGVSLTLAPLRLGAGIKVKVIESLIRGRPVLATPMALAGVPPELASLIPSLDANAVSAGPSLRSVLTSDWAPTFSLAAELFSVAKFRESIATLLGRITGEDARVSRD